MQKEFLMGNYLGQTMAAMWDEKLVGMMDGCWAGR